MNNLDDGINPKDGRAVFSVMTRGPLVDAFFFLLPGQKMKQFPTGVAEGFEDRGTCVHEVAVESHEELRRFILALQVPRLIHAFTYEEAPDPAAKILLQELAQDGQNTVEIVRCQEKQIAPRPRTSDGKFISRAEFGDAMR